MRRLWNLQRRCIAEVENIFFVLENLRRLNGAFVLAL
jgi:hypothetical protein